MTDDRASVDASGVSNGLIPGEALVGAAVSVGEHRGEGCPDRRGEDRDVFFSNLFKPDPVILFALAGAGFGGGAVAAGCLHGIITFPSTPGV